MSRSYRKNPVVTDNNDSHQSKKLASRSLRRKLKNSDELLKGSSYKKHYESWDICDYKFRKTREEAIEGYYSSCNRYKYFKEEFPTLEDYLKWWYKTYLRK